MTKLLVQIDDEIREMNEVEKTAYEEMQAKAILKENEAATKAADKAALLTKLGITADEAKLLLS